MRSALIVAVLMLSFAAGLVSAFIAYKKQRPPILWFCIGFLLNVVAILAIVFLSQRTDMLRKKVH
jgi:hypothetical protein